MGEYMHIRQQLESRFSKCGFSMAEALISFMLIGLALAATLPLMTQMSQVKTGTDKNALQCITNNASTNWYDDDTGETSTPDSGDYPECNAAILDAQYDRNKSVETAIWIADHGSTDVKKTLAKKMLRSACDLGGEKACDYFINSCWHSGSGTAPYCDDATSYLDLTYYLHIDNDTNTNPGATYINEQLEGLLPKMVTNLVNEVSYAKDNNQLPIGGSYDPPQNLGDNFASDLATAKIYIQGCNLGYDAACQEAYDNDYNTSCTAVKTNWSAAPTGNYYLTHEGDPTSYDPVEVYCNMNSLATAAITGCNGDPSDDTDYVLDDCSAGYDNLYNRSCAQVFTNYSPVDGDYMLTSAGDPSSETPVLTTCATNSDCIDNGAGSECDDGTIYAGETSDGGQLFAAPYDQGSGVIWATQLTKAVGIIDTNDGASNTAALVAIADYDSGSDVGPSNDFFAPYLAAHTCNDLNDTSTYSPSGYLGHTDWYLPASQELYDILDNVGDAVGMDNGSYYWSSTELSSTIVRVYRKSTGSSPASSTSQRKYSTDLLRTRCVRQGTGTSCTDGTCDTAGEAVPDTSLYAGMSGTKYLFIPPVDQTSTTWNNGEEGYQITNTLSNTDGRDNVSILTSEPVASNVDAPFAAMDVCEALNTANSGSGTSFDGGTTYYNDWYLPATTELQQLYTYSTTGAFDDTFSASPYWASTECNENNAKYVYFTSGSSSNYPKSYGCRVRCVRRTY